MNKKYTFIDLFAGCGGLSEGFLQTGRYKPLAHVEWEKPMVDTLRNRLVNKWNFSEKKAIEDVVLFDIQKTDELINGNWSKESIKEYGNFNGSKVIKKGLKGIVGKKHVDIIIGGPPCQAYSIHGRATDKDSMQHDYRNFLFESFVKVVEAFKPTIFVFENVPGILSAKPGGRHVTERIYEAFGKAGYIIRSPKELSDSIFDAVNFQVPQFRKRVIILGVRKDGNLNLDDFYKSIKDEESDKPYKTVKDAIGMLPKIYPLPNPIKEGRKNISHMVVDEPLNVTQHEPRYHALREIEIFKEWITKDMNHLPHHEQTDYYFNLLYS
jgi:DNA (cytosine-5)-methyltransferase 1